MRKIVAWCIVSIVGITGISATSLPDLVMKVPATPSGNFEVIKARRKSDPLNWPATFWFKSNRVSKTCTATAVGPRVILTAAHCIATGSDGLIELPTGSMWIVSCEAHDRYSENAPAFDVALCATKTDIKLQGESPYERIAADNAHVSMYDPVLLVGFGCNDSGTTGELWEGTAYRTINEPDFAGIVTNNGAATCSGDSGGANYKTMYNGLSRAIVGTTIRGDNRSISYLTDMHTSSIRQFMITWGKSKQLMICGVNNVLSTKCKT